MGEVTIIITGIVLSVLLIFILVRLHKPVAPGTSEEKETMARALEAKSTELKVSEERIRNLDDQLEKLRITLAQKETYILDLHSALSRAETEKEGLLAKLSENKEEQTRKEEETRLQFKNLANEILEEKTKKFTEQNKARLDEILAPLGEKIRAFEKRVEETYDKESKQRFSLEKEIRNLAELNNRISEDARNLTSALKSDTKKQGNWGELVLERILESSGLVKGQEYIREFSTRDDQGDTYRPDVVVRLPDHKHIIIDSKVSLNAFTDFVSAEIPEEKEKFLKLHLLSVRNHVKMLSEKGYQKLPGLDSPDYVLLFIPIESSFSTALQYDPDLFNFAWEKNVVIVSPTTLLATLRTVSSIWKHEKQEVNAKEIARQTGELYDKFVGFVGDLEEIGNKIDSTRKTYDNAMNKLNTGKGNLIGRAKKIRELGIKPSKNLPKHMTDQTEEEDET